MDFSMNRCVLFIIILGGIRLEIGAVHIIVCIIVLFISGLSKGISGLGIPIIATPILTLIFDLQTAIVMLAPSTLLTDFIMVKKFFVYDKGIIKNISLISLMGMVGIVIGTHL